MSDSTPTTPEDLLQCIRYQRLRLADLAFYDQARPFAPMYESEALLQQFDELARRVKSPHEVEHMLAEPQQLATLFALAPWPVLDVVLPPLESAWEAAHGTELQQYTRQHCSAELLPVFDYRLRCVERVRQIVQLVRWQHPAVVDAVGAHVRIRHGA